MSEYQAVRLPDGWLAEELEHTERTRQLTLTVDDLWDALREVACATKPHTDAKTIVTLRREHVKKAFDKLSKTHDFIGLNALLTKGES